MSEAMAVTPRVRVGVVGLGQWGRNHADRKSVV